MRVEVFLEDRSIQRGRHPDLVQRRWEIEIFRQDADDDIGLPVHHQGLTQGLRLHRKFLPPKGVTENDHAILAGFSFRFKKRTAERELETEGWEKRRCDLLTE